MSRSFKIPDDFSYSVISSSIGSNTRLDDSDSNPRPCTARSLPTPNNNSNLETIEPEKSSLNMSYLNVDNSSARSRNLSCPSISSLPPQPVKVINVTSNKLTVATGAESSSNFSEKKQPKPSRLNVTSANTAPNSPTSPNFFNTNITSTSSSKSNLDYFLDYSINPFTTKYEIIGSTIERSPSLKPPKPKSNVNLKDLDSSTTSIKRSASISNLGSKQNLQGDIIVSPNHVKPSYANSTTTPSDRQNRNNSTNNLFPVKQLSPPIQNKISSTSTSTSIYDRMSSISDENLANDSHSSVSKFKIANLNGFTNNNQLVRIAESVYCGNINSIRNERALCKLGIEFVVDMSNMRPDDLSRAQTLGKLPCLCKRQQHSRLYLTIEIRETSFKALFGAFAEVNKFIQQARKKNSIDAFDQKKVLIFGREGLGTDQVRCACAQYLMVECGMKLVKALNVLQAKSKGSMQKCYIEYLNQFELYLKHMSNNVNFGDHNEDENDDDDEDYDEYELESNEDLEEEKIYRQMASASKKSSNTNDLELDNLSDLSDNFKIVPTSAIDKGNAKFSKIEKSHGSGDDLRRESLRKSSSKNKSENFNGSFKMAWM